MFTVHLFSFGYQYVSTGTEASSNEAVRGIHFRVLAALDQYGAASQAELGRQTGAIDVGALYLSFRR